LDGQSEVVDIPEVARRLGISRSACYEIAARGKLPVPVIRCGKRVMVARRALDALLGTPAPTVSNAATETDRAA
jgi:excisionase family DNA binding protein